MGQTKSRTMYVAGMGANGGKCWHSGLGVMCFFLLVWVTGVVLLSVGLNQKSSYAEYDPYVDFVPVNTGCRIVSVSYKAASAKTTTPTASTSTLTTSPSR